MGGCKTEFDLGGVIRRAFLLKWVVFGVWIGCSGLGGPSARAITPHHFRTAEQRVMGSGRMDAVDSSAAAGRAIVFELGQRWLFGIKGLRADGFRLGWQRGRLGLFISGSNVVSPLGSERTGGLAGHFQAASHLQAAWRLSASLVDIPPYARSSLATLSGSAAGRLSGGLSAGFEVEDVRLAGEVFPGADITVWTSLWPLPAASLMLTVCLSRWGERGFGFAGTFQLARGSTLSAGYDDASRQIKTALSLSGRTVGCGLGAMFHPLLGVSKEINLRWQH